MKRLLSCAIVVWCGALPVAAQTIDIDTHAATISSRAVEAISLNQASAEQEPSPKKESAPEHLSTGWSSLLKDSASDFVAFPKRRSTWTILGIGAAAALAVHPADDYVETHIVGNDAANNFFSLGQVIGSWYVQFGSAVGLWAVGRYVVAPAESEPRTNKFSEVGFDLLRAQILSGVLVQG